MTATTRTVYGGLALLFLLFALFGVWDMAAQAGIWRKGLATSFLTGSASLAFHFGLQALRGSNERD